MNLSLSKLEYEQIVYPCVAMATPATQHEFTVGDRLLTKLEALGVAVPQTRQQIQNAAFPARLLAGDSAELGVESPEAALLLRWLPAATAVLPLYLGRLVPGIVARLEADLPDGGEGGDHG